MTVDISPKLVKELREKTGAGMMNCKKALQECEGDFDKAVEALRQKGLASADKKAGRQASEGLIESYIHTGGKLGVLVEVNCETDFVARREEFQDLARNLAMQIAASPTVNYVSVNDIPADVIEREKSIEVGKDDLSKKPEEIRAKIVEGRIEKILKTQSLLDQPYIRDNNQTVEELIKQTISQLGENIKVARFIRFQLGE
jgi:elongation factor Ts